MNFLKSIRFNYILSSIITILLGIALVIFPRTSASVICMCLGVVLLICGVLNIISYFTQKDKIHFFEYDFLFGMVFSIVGLWLVLNPEAIIMILPVIFAIVIILHGLIELQNSLNLRRFDYNRWWVIFILALITVVLGVIMLANPFIAASTLVIFIGFSLIYNGVVDIWMASRISKLTKDILD